MSVEKCCNSCGKSFLVPQRRSDAVKFCSWECKNHANRRVLVCKACGNISFRAKSDKSKYCSTGCFHEASKGVSHQVKPEQQRYYKTCEVCAESFRVTLTRKDTARFCSRKCQSNSAAFRLETSERQRGEKHWRWSGGVYKSGSGYVSRKTKRLSFETRRGVHRTVIEEALLAVEPEHPFLVIKDGEKRLSSKIEVHHIDRVRSNNALSNLLAVTRKAHAAIHHRNEKPKPWQCWPSNPQSW